MLKYILCCSIASFLCASTKTQEASEISIQTIGKSTFYEVSNTQITKTIKGNELVLMWNDGSFEVKLSNKEIDAIAPLTEEKSYTITRKVGFIYKEENQAEAERLQKYKEYVQNFQSVEKILIPKFNKDIENAVQQKNGLFTLQQVRDNVATIQNPKGSQHDYRANQVFHAYARMLDQQIFLEIKITFTKKSRSGNEWFLVTFEAGCRKNAAKLNVIKAMPQDTRSSVVSRSTASGIELTFADDWFDIELTTKDKSAIHALTVNQQYQINRQIYDSKQIIITFTKQKDQSGTGTCGIRFSEAIPYRPYARIKPNITFQGVREEYAKMLYQFATDESYWNNWIKAFGVINERKELIEKITTLYHCGFYQDDNGSNIASTVKAMNKLGLVLDVEPGDDKAKYNFVLSNEEISKLEELYQPTSPDNSCTITQEIKLFANMDSIQKVWSNLDDKEKEFLQTELAKPKSYLLSTAYITGRRVANPSQDLKILHTYIKLAQNNNLPSIHITFTKKLRSDWNPTVRQHYADKTWFLVTFGFEYKDKSGNTQTVEGRTFNQVRDEYLKYLSSI